MFLRIPVLRGLSGTWECFSPVAGDVPLPLPTHSDEEVDLDGAVGQHDCVQDSGRNWLRVTCEQVDIDRWLHGHRETRRTSQDMKATPRRISDSMISSKTRWQRGLVKRSDGSRNLEPVGNFGAIA